MILFVLSLHVVWCLPSSFCSREYVGWKRLFEKFQEGCLVHANRLYLRGKKEAFGLTHPINLLLMRTWFGGRCCFVFGPPDIWIKWVYLYWASMLPGFCSREHMVFKKKLFKEFQDGCFMHGHLWYLNGLIWAIIQCLLFALVYAQIDICFGKKDIVWRTEDSCHCGTTQWTGRL